MKALLILPVLAVGLPLPDSAQKRRGGYQPFPHRIEATTEVEVALDVAGGRDKVYLHQVVDPANVNLLWAVHPVGESVMLVSRVDGMALDANGGRGTPYPRTADPANVNHLWLLARVGDHYMIWSRVAGVVLDANRGLGKPYLSAEPDARNPNHLWELRKAGDHVLLVPKVRATVTTPVEVLTR